LPPGPRRRLGHEDLLRELLEAEITSRRQSTARRLLREARLPDVKTLDQVDWQALKGVAKPKILELASCQFITNAESVIVAGPIGPRSQKPAGHGRQTKLRRSAAY
jgi:DNA replication protein DnaC